MDIAKTLKTLRQGKKLTQDALAKELSVSKSTICMYENGERIPPSDMVERLADFFNVSINSLYGRDDSISPLTPSHKVEEEDIKVALFGGDSKVTDEMWNEVKQYAEYIKSKYNK